MYIRFYYAYLVKCAKLESARWQSGTFDKSFAKSSLFIALLARTFWFFHEIIRQSFIASAEIL